MISLCVPSAGYSTFELSLAAEVDLMLPSQVDMQMLATVGLRPTLGSATSFVQHPHMWPTAAHLKTKHVVFSAVHILK
jgi:hypothetical protein